MVIERIAVHFDEEEGHLRLDCADEAFDHILGLVVGEAEAAERLGPSAGTIRSIVVRRRLTLRDPMAGRSARGLRGLLIGATLAAALAIQVVGIVAVVRWLWALGH